MHTLVALLVVRNAVCRQLFIVFGAALFSLVASKGDDPARLPVPDTVHQEAALKLVKGLFKEEFAQRKAEDRKALSLKLLQQAEETKDDPAGKYVLFAQARDLAAEIGDLELALRPTND